MRLVVLVLFVCVAAFLSLSVGAVHMSAFERLAALFGHGDALHVTIMQDVRAPRSLLGLVIGAGLGASGAALQGYTRNPLADPGILGFSATAALGAVAALYFGHREWVVPSALAGAAIGASLLLILAGRKTGALQLVLAGVGIGALATALTGLLMNFAPNPWALSEIAYWLMGSLKNAGLDAAILCGGLTLAGLAVLFVTGPDLRSLSLGEDTARALGVLLGRLRLLLVAGVALCVGSGVAVAGAIGFVGLFVPHILRFIFGPDPARLIPLSALGGAGFLTLADTLTRLISINGTSLYLGILSSLIGAPFFIWLAFRSGRI